VADEWERVLGEAIFPDHVTLLEFPEGNEKIHKKSELRERMAW